MAETGAPDDDPREELEARSARELEWPELCRRIADHALSASGREACSNLTPAQDAATARVRLSLIDEVLRLFEEDAELPAGDFPSIDEALLLLTKGGVAAKHDLLRVLRVLALAQRLSQFARQHKREAPHLYETLATGSEIGPLAEVLERCLDDEGEIRDGASEGLRAARSSVSALRRRMQGRLAELVRRYREVLQDAYFAERDGRYVLPVRTDSAGRVEGIVFGTSASGATLYIEPQELAQLGGQLRLAEAEVERQEALVVAELSELLEPHAEDLWGSQEVCRRADELRAIALFSRRIDARVVPIAETDEIHALDARHPLLCGQLDFVVPNDLDVQGAAGLLLSGPNAGGKTVALKCFGLLALMQASGLPVPCKTGSKIGFFHRVYSDIGDDQSLFQSLSTFSGHVERMHRFLRASGSATLVLIDELMGGTDPDEGAALAISTADALVGTGAAVVVTTHYQKLKEHAASNEKWTNAAVGFDFDTMQPTFRLERGVPGASSALAVARRHGLPTQVVERAARILPDIDLRQRDVAEELERRLVQVARRETELQGAIREQEIRSRRLERQTQDLRERSRRELAQESEELRAAVRQARADVQASRGKLKSASSAQHKQISKQIDRAASVVALGSDVDRHLRGGEGDASAKEQTLEPGTRIRLRGMNVEAEVLERFSDGSMRVQAGSLKMVARPSDVSTVVGSREKSEGGRKKKKQHGLLGASSAAARQAPPRSQDLVLDLRGIRVEEALALLDAFIDELLRRQEFSGYVLHGHGTGAMKEAVRQHLRAHSCVETSRPAERDEGGDAHTLFWLRGS